MSNFFMTYSMDERSFLWPRKRFFPSQRTLKIFNAFPQQFIEHIKMNHWLLPYFFTIKDRNSFIECEKKNFVLKPKPKKKIWVEVLKIYIPIIIIRIKNFDSTPKVRSNTIYKKKLLCYRITSIVFLFHDTRKKFLGKGNNKKFNRDDEENFMCEWFLLERVTAICNGCICNFRAWIATVKENKVKWL